MILTTVALALALPAAAFALSLDEAKSSGYVGERADGYLGVVADSAGVSDLVKQINNQRRAEYQRIAGQNGTAASDIEKLAAAKAYEKTPAGQYVQGANGAWMKK
jgi:uncharacterized protein YdbL (DUF1318 family)